MEGDIVVVSGEDVLYRASSLGSCTVSLAASRQEIEPYRGPLPDNLRETFEKGHQAEKVGEEWFEHRGWRVTGRQMEVTIQLTGRIRVVGHIDFMVCRTGIEPVPWTVVDVKRQNDEEWAKGSIKDSWLWEKYRYQFSVYSVATNMPFAVERVNDNGEVKLEFVDGLYTRGEILGRVLEVEKLARTELTGTCDKGEFPCPYFRFHKGEEVPVVEVEDEELASLALHYKRLEGDVSALQERRGELRKRIVEKVTEGRVKDKDTGIEVWVTRYDIKERTVKAGTGVRVTVRLNDATRPDE